MDNKFDETQWQKVAIQSKGGTVCSYRFMNSNSDSNVYQVRITDYKNMKVGLYFFSQFWDQIVDYKVLEESDCLNMKYCSIYVEYPHNKAPVNSMIFSLDDSRFAMMNFIPIEPEEGMIAKVEYRLVNKLYQEYVLETLGLLFVGVSLIAIFSVILFKSITTNSHEQAWDQHDNLAQSFREINEVHSLSDQDL